MQSIYFGGEVELQLHKWYPEGSGLALSASLRHRRSKLLRGQPSTQHPLDGAGFGSSKNSRLALVRKPYLPLSLAEAHAAQIIFFKSVHIA